jgi:hypothetical protein
MIRFGGQLVYRYHKRVLRARKVTRQEEWSVYGSQQVRVGGPYHGDVCGVAPCAIAAQIEIRGAEVGGDLWQVNDALLERAKSKRAGRGPWGHRRSREAAHQEPTIVGKAVGKELGQGLIGARSSCKGCQSETSSKPEKDRENHRRTPFGPELGATSEPNQCHLQLPFHHL